MATVFIPNVLRPFADGQEQVDVPGRTLRQVFANLEAAYPDMKGQIVEDGDIRPGLAIVVDNEITGQGLIQPVEEDSEIRILPAIGGGATNATNPPEVGARFHRALDAPKRLKA